MFGSLFKIITVASAESIGVGIGIGIAIVIGKRKTTTISNAIATPMMLFKQYEYCKYCTIKYLHEYKPTFQNAWENAWVSTFSSEERVSTFSLSLLQL